MQGREDTSLVSAGAEDAGGPAGQPSSEAAMASSPPRKAKRPRGRGPSATPTPAAAAAAAAATVAGSDSAATHTEGADAGGGSGGQGGGRAPSVDESSPSVTVSEGKRPRGRPKFARHSATAKLLPDATTALTAAAAAAAASDSPPEPAPSTSSGTGEAVDAGQPSSQEPSASATGRRSKRTQLDLEPFSLAQIAAYVAEAAKCRADAAASAAAAAAAATAATAAAAYAADAQENLPNESESSGARGTQAGGQMPSASAAPRPTRQGSDPFLSPIKPPGGAVRISSHEDPPRPAGTSFAGGVPFPALPVPNITLADLAGVDDQVEEIRRMLVHFRRPEIFRSLGVSPPRGMLLHGPPGCGKTYLARAVAGELRFPLLEVAGPELVAVLGQTEQRLRELFEKATRAAPCVLFIDELDTLAPGRNELHKDVETRIVAQLLSCLDALGRPSGYSPFSASAGEVLVLGATSRPELLDPALRRPGRFDREFRLGIPNACAREAILKVLCRPLRLSTDIDYHALAKWTPGFVGSDLQAFTCQAGLVAGARLIDNETNKINGNSDTDAQDEARSSETPATPAEKLDFPMTKMDETDENDLVSDVDDKNAKVLSTPDVKNKNAKGSSTPDVHNVQVLDELDTEGAPVPVIKRVPKKSLGADVCSSQSTVSSDNMPQNVFITQKDFKTAIKRVQPSAKREGFTTEPDISWDDVGALTEVREELHMAILAPIQHPEIFEEAGLTASTGVLLCGPPGCGKTLIAKAIANEAHLNFISIQGAECFSKYVGESEKNVRQYFTRARNSAPCVIFFDEVDAMCPRRTGEGSLAIQGVVNQLLIEMDGVDNRKGVFLLAASNRPDIIDPAFLRPGRLDRIVFVGLPVPEERADILKAITKNGTKPCIAPEVDLKSVGESDDLDGCSGADLNYLVSEAGRLAILDSLATRPSHTKSSSPGPQPVVSGEHIRKAIRRLRPSVSPAEIQYYEQMRIQLSSLKTTHGAAMECRHCPPTCSVGSQTLP